MPSRVLPAATAALGLFLAAGAAFALSVGALVPAASFAAAAAAHLGLAAGLRRREEPPLVAVASAAVGVVDLTAVVVAMTFIVGIETAIGVDLGAHWFAPLNGYGTIAVAAVITLIAIGLVTRALTIARVEMALPALRG